MLSAGASYKCKIPVNLRIKWPFNDRKDFFNGYFFDTM
jgi:hypothetical protein